jgi:hypothetical protein
MPQCVLMIFCVFLLFSNPQCKGAAGCCPGIVYHQTCLDKMVWIDTYKPTGWSILCHNGKHAHPWPEAKKANPLSKDLLCKAFKDKPRAGAFELKVCELPHYHT